MYYFENHPTPTPIDKNVNTKNILDDFRLKNMNRGWGNNDKEDLIVDEEIKPIYNENICDSEKIEIFNVINTIVNEIYKKDPKQVLYVTNMAKVRDIDPKILLDNHCFYCRDAQYLMYLFSDLPIYKINMHILTSNNSLWNDRFVIPIRDFYNNVYGFVGYHKFVTPKYVEWSSPIYKQTKIKALGLNDIEYVLDQRYLIITEGVFDYFRGKINGLPIIANLGIRFSDPLKYLIQRVDFVITAYDNDETGIKNSNKIQNLHPYSYILKFKDLPSGVKCDLDEVLKDPCKVVSLIKFINRIKKFKGIRQKKVILL